jgi:hypothetical protein
MKRLVVPYLSTHGLLFGNWSDEIHDNVYDIIQEVTYADSKYVKALACFFCLVFVIWQPISSWIYFWITIFQVGRFLALCTPSLGTFFFSLSFQHFLIFQKSIYVFNKDRQENVLQDVSNKRKRTKLLNLSHLMLHPFMVIVLGKVMKFY